MDENHLTLYGIGYILGFLTQFAVLVACVILLFRRRSLAAILMLIGSLTTLMLSGLSAFSGLLADSPQDLVLYQGITIILKELCYLIFAVGLLLLILQYIRQYRLLQA
ncbi:hypothetical protein [Poritiphilus flavus]|uniref:Uncharacterized protein n=1 Tax=Poritiphilus flavus TaxID=2697053 RepID=A0A6L9EF89_9FLAO|nr:hypothetical protein [Poritiphilus flavus]NAS13351.1 hypothetical protein [Poritiphilus flavus]